MQIIQLIESISQVAAIIGVIIVICQLQQSRKQAQTAFEDSMTKEYRELAATMPSKAEKDARNEAGMKTPIAPTTHLFKVWLPATF